jgi:hypothetical protein
MRLEDGFLHRFHERTSVYEIAGMKERSAMMRERGGGEEKNTASWVSIMVYLFPFFYILV